METKTCVLCGKDYITNKCNECAKNMPAMSLDDIYRDKKSIIEYSMQEAFNSIYQEIDKDSKYQLSDDELIELVYDLMKKYLK